MNRWTPDQKLAIEDRDKNLLISAAAGSGKTAVLVERITKLILEDKVDIDKMLIVTFTNAAAGEMRERILKAILDRVNTDLKNKQHLQRQITLLNKAHITTIHSFCIDVVRKNFHYTDIDPSFKIADTTESGLMIQEALDELLEEEYGDANEEFINLVESYGGNRQDIKLQELIVKIYSFIQSKPEPLLWLGQSVEEFNTDELKLEDSMWIKSIKNSIQLDLQGAYAAIEKGISICRGICGPVEYEPALLADRIDLEELLDALEISYESFIRKINGISYTKLGRISKVRKQEVDESKQKEVKDLRDRYKDVIKGLLQYGSLKLHVNQLNQIYPTMRYLEYLVAEFKLRYSEKKLERGLLDFDDLLHYALDILRNDEVSEEYKKRFDHIFIDEYQDSNIVQETLINYIARENNVFMVGDVKQSIYRFRLADPSLFIDKYTRFSRDDIKNKRIDLSMNFRTRGEILEGINHIFKNIMSSTLGDIEYTKDAYLYNGIKFEGEEESGIEINILEDKIDEDYDDIEELSKIEVEAEFVARKIKSLVGTRTYDPKIKDVNKYRNLEYRDFVILLRSPKNWSPVFNEILSKHGIPVYSDDSYGYFDTIEVNIFLDLLKLVDNVDQDLPLISVLRSPIGGFSVEELIDIRVANKGSSYYTAILNYIEVEDNTLARKLVDFLGKIKSWNKQSRYLKLDEFIWNLLMETGYYNYIGAMPSGNQRQANLRLLVDRASQFDKSSLNGLFLFLRFIDKLTKSKGDMGPAKILGERDNIVRLMSIHKSKGLEFPVVILAGASKKFNLQDLREDVLLHKELGLGPKFVDVQQRTYSHTLPKDAIKARVRLENMSEEMRVLYVALTRAVDKLILVGSVKKLDKSIAKWMKGMETYNLVKCDNYLDWIMSVIINNNCCKDLWEREAIFPENKEDEIIPFKIGYINKGDIIGSKIDNESKHRIEEFLDNPRIDDKKYLGIIDKRFRYKYHLEEDIVLPSKMSVSDINKGSIKDIDQVMNKIPKLKKVPTFIEGKEVTSAERGTIVHFILQHIDLTKCTNLEDIVAEIDRMEAIEIITKEEAELIEPKKILSFFGSGIGKRMLNSVMIKREAPFVFSKKAKHLYDEINNDRQSILVQGIIDCYFEEDDNLILVDYKTGFSQLKSTDQQIIDNYKEQISLYKEALEKIIGKRVTESYIYMLDISREVRVL